MRNSERSTLSSCAVSRDGGFNFSPMPFIIYEILLYTIIIYIYMSVYRFFRYAVMIFHRNILSLAQEDFSGKLY